MEDLGILVLEALVGSSLSMVLGQRVVQMLVCVNYFYVHVRMGDISESACARDTVMYVCKCCGWFCFLVIIMGNLSI